VLVKLQIDSNLSSGGNLGGSLQLELATGAATKQRRGGNKQQQPLMIGRRQQSQQNPLQVAPVQCNSTTTNVSESPAHPAFLDSTVVTLLVKERKGPPGRHARATISEDGLIIVVIVPQAAAAKMKLLTRKVCNENLPAPGRQPQGSCLTMPLPQQRGQHGACQSSWVCPRAGICTATRLA
jgi:hypothetical protein